MKASGLPVTVATPGPSVRAASRLPTALICTAAAALLLAAEVEARMYQWVSPGSGVTQLSGEPPPWYRSGRRGPRVMVFHNGTLVDDTAIELPAEQGMALRDEAFAEAEAATRRQALRQLERTAARDAARRRPAETAAAADSSAPAAVAATGDGDGQDGGAAVPDTLPGDGPLDATFVDQLKSMIEAFDRQNTRGTGEP